MSITIHTLNNTEKNTYWAHVRRAEAAKSNLSTLFDKCTFDDKDAIQTFVNAANMDDDTVVALHYCGKFTKDFDSYSGEFLGWQFAMPGTQDVRDALFDWEENGCRKLGRKVHTA